MFTVFIFYSLFMTWFKLVLYTRSLDPSLFMGLHFNQQLAWIIINNWPKVLSNDKKLNQGPKLELSDKKFNDNQGHILVQIWEFLVQSLCLKTSLSSKQQTNNILRLAWPIFFYFTNGTITILSLGSTQSNGSTSISCCYIPGYQWIGNQWQNQW